MGTSEGAKKGWTEERRIRQRETARKTRSNPEWIAAQAERTRQQWANNPKRRITQGDKISKALKQDDWQRFLSYVAAPNEEGCELWTGGIVQGYAKFPIVPKQGVKTKDVSAARFRWEKERGEISAGMTIEHDCHTQHQTCEGGTDCVHRRCVNLDHLRLVTAQVNTSLGRSRQELMGLVNRDKRGRITGRRKGVAKNG